MIVEKIVMNGKCLLFLVDFGIAIAVAIVILTVRVIIALLFQTLIIIREVVTGII